MTRISDHYITIQRMQRRENSRRKSQMFWLVAPRCAKPQASVAGQPGDEFSLKIDSVEGRKHLPIVTLQRAA